MAATEDLNFELDLNDSSNPDYESITPEQVLKFKAPTQDYLCPLNANVYGIDFLSFKIRDMKSNKTLFNVERDKDAPSIDLSGLTPEQEEAVRCISYDFGPDFLTLESIGTMLEFSVGPMEVPNFRMIERHYFKDQLVKSYDFNFGFCIPNSTNTWEAIYDVPPLQESLRREMETNPYATQSDSFYFVGDTLIMHNKAKYAYTSEGALA